jgi:hypothetical protein
VASTWRHGPQFSILTCVHLFMLIVRIRCLDEVLLPRGGEVQCLEQVRFNALKKVGVGEGRRQGCGEATRALVK